MSPALRTTPLLLLATLAACTGDDPEDDTPAPIAEDIFGRLGDPVPYATPEQLETFQRGVDVMTHRFTVEEGLGPSFNVTFCGACHEKPVFGGSAGLYRNFWLTGKRDAEFDRFFPADAFRNTDGVIELYAYEGTIGLREPGPDGSASDDPPVGDSGDSGDSGTWSGLDGNRATRGFRPPVDPEINVVAQRNPIPFFGAGLIAELPGEAILKHADPDDADGDGISGRPNYDQEFVGRFGVKAQTVSIEGFIRGPLKNHLGITTDPLTEAQKAALPVDSSSGSGVTLLDAGTGLHAYAQAAPSNAPLYDDDAVTDPEMSTEDLFDVVAMAMLMAAPQPEPLDEQTTHGRDVFVDVGCAKCHVPQLDGPRGGIPLYSDLLLHDMGPDLADGLEPKDAKGYEFRTQPLWGVIATAPYMHDGRAQTLEEAVGWHGGEATGVRDDFLALPEGDQADLYAFLASLGGRDQFSPGLIPPDEPEPDVGAWGGPRRALAAEEQSRFTAARHLFDREFGLSDGIGNPRFNADSCRACHFEPVVGGAGPRGVNVVRHGVLSGGADFAIPQIGTILHRSTALKTTINRPQPDASIFELRQTPHLFGLGEIETIADATILAHVDVHDADGDGISGKPSWTDGGRLGRFGWKGDIPNLAEFVRDAVTMEMGLTMPFEEGLSFGRIQDNDDVPDPEFPLEDVDLLRFYLTELAPPPRGPGADGPEALLGEALFAEVGCAACHIPALEGSDGPVPLYSDLLLHEIMPPDYVGIELGSATMREFRTPPLWGVSATAPYLHDGRADTLRQAIEGHHGEGVGSREAFLGLLPDEQEAVLAFLGTL